MDGNNIYTELLNYSEFSPDVPTTSAFVQQYKKFFPDAFEFLFHAFNQFFTHFKAHKGYRLLAVDGHLLNTAQNPNVSSTYSQTKSDARGFNLLHLNAMYNL